MEPTMAQDDTYSLASFPSEHDPLEPPDDHSTCASSVSSVSHTSTDSLLINDAPIPDIIEPDEPTRGRPNASRLNHAWQQLFRDAFQPPTTAPVHHDGPINLPPPLYQAPNAHVGDAFHKCPPDLFRVWSVNANGLSVADDFCAWHSLCTNLVPKRPSAIAISEPNIDFLQGDIRQQIENIFRQHFGSVRLITATSCANAPTPWKPGGVLLAIVGQWAQAVTATSRDDLGRWVSATITGSAGNQATIFSCYNVVHTTIANSGPSTVYAQQYQLLRLAGDRNPDPRRRFIDDLHMDLANRRRNAEELIICGDFNEQLGADTQLMARIAGSHDLFDVHQQRLGDTSNVPTYIRGTKKLDYVLASIELRTTVRSCGINLFNELLQSDHRALFTDFALHTFLGPKPPALCRPDLRFISTDSAAVSTFVGKMFRHLEENKVFHSFAEFMLDANVAEQPWDLANKIDTQIGHAFACGEKVCAKPRRAPWSVKLHRASSKVRFWKTALAQRNTGVQQEEVLQEIGAIVWKTPDLIPTIPSNTKVLINVGRAATKALTRIRKTAKKARQAEAREHREAIAQRISPKDTDVEVAVRNLDRRQADNRMYGRIRASIKPTQSAPLTKVELVEESEHVHPVTGTRVRLRKVRTIDTKRELENAIIARNKRHFAQATGTPWTQFPLNLIGSKNGYNVFRDDAGNDITLPDTAFLETATVLDILRQRLDEPTPQWSDEITFDQFISAFLHWRETTSTSPSGRHLGLYRALITAYIDASGEFSNLDDDTNTQNPTAYDKDDRSDYSDDSTNTSHDSIRTIQEQAESILRIIYGLASTAARLGFYLRRWTQVVNVMIYKKPGVIELDKLRVIHLFEADFNLLVGVFFGRRAMQHQTDHQLIHPGQFGRPGGECQDAAFDKVLTNMISTFSQTPMAQFESDATACFDREVMNFVLTCFSTNGAPPGPLRMWEQTLYHIVHRVKTAYGISHGHYKFEADSAIHGPGQGSTGGSGSCSTMTSPLIEGMDRLSNGLTLYDPSQKLQHQSTVKMFIDDASNATGKFLEWLHAPPQAQELCAMIQHDAQTWERLLWTSGGLLNLTKCLYYLSYWTFDSEGRALLTPKTELPQLYLTSGDDMTLVPVKQHNFDEPHKYLGNLMAPNLNMNAALEQLRTTSNTFARSMATCPLSKRDAWIAYFAIYIPGMTYTLPVSAHAAIKLRKLQGPALRAVLNKIGFNRNTARAVVFGPCMHGALAMRDLPVEQGIAILTMLLRHLRAPTPQGKLLLITLAWWQLVLGTSYQLLQYPDPILLHDDAHILSAARLFLRSVGGQLDIQELQQQLPQPLRDRDHCLMEVINALPHMTRAKSKAFNRVRLHYGVTHLSELTTADGTTLSRAAWDGTRQRLSPLLWPFQPTPGPKSFRTWRRLLATSFLRGHRARVSVRTRDLSLRTALGSWHPGSDGFRQQWTSFFSPQENLLYRVSEQGDTYHIHPALRIRRRPKHPVRAFNDDPTASCRRLPHDAVPVDCGNEPNKLVTSIRTGTLAPAPPPPPPHSRWPDYLASLPEWEQFLLQHINLLDKARLLECLRTSDHLCIASDGGAADCTGSFGSLLATNDTIILECGGLVQGADPKSFRAEAYGLLAILRLVHHLRWFYMTRNSNLTFAAYTDSESLILRLEASLRLTYTAPRRTLFSESDVEMQIIDALGCFSQRPSLIHVEGHQDTKYPDRPPTWASTLNQRCDEIATHHLDRATHILRLASFFPASKAQLNVQGTTITHHIPSQLRSFAGLRAHRQYMCTHHAWAPETFDLVDWPRLHSSTRSISFLKRLFVIKWVNDLLPFQHQQFKFNQSPSASCPSSCGCTQEDWSHFLRCPHKHRRQAWLEFRPTLLALFERHSLDPSLRRLLLHLIFSVVSPEEPRLPLDSLSETHVTLLNTQQTLGPDSIFYGLFAHGWTTLQHKYLQARDLPRHRNQANSATNALITAILLHVHTCWLLRNEHLHGLDPMNHIPYKKLHLLAQIRELYDSAPLMLAADRDIFAFPFEHRHLQPTTSLSAFFTWANPLVAKSISDANELGSHFRHIDSYFRPLIPTELFDIVLLQ